MPRMFRSAYGKAIVIEVSEEIRKDLAGLEGIEDAPMILAQGFIDRQGRFRLRVIAVMKTKDEERLFVEVPQDTVYNLLPERYARIRAGNPSREVDIRKCFAFSFGKLKEFYGEKVREDARRNTVLDPIRDIRYPDRIPVILARKNEERQIVHVDVEEVDGTVGYGKILQDSEARFGYHAGDPLAFLIVEREGQVFCVNDLTPQRVYHRKDLADGKILKSLIRQSRRNTPGHPMGGALLELIPFVYAWVPGTEKAGIFVPLHVDLKGEEYLPVFSDLNEAVTPDEETELRQMPFTKLMDLADKDSLSGIMINPFSEPFAVPGKMFRMLKTFPNVIISEKEKTK